MTDPILQYFQESREVLDRAMASAEFIDTCRKIADSITSVLTVGGKLMTCGNGGSAGDAQHIAGEFISRLNYDRPPTAALALTVDSSVLTAVGNDYGYERIFERQVLGLGRRGDALLAISTSGNSPNVLRAMDAARSLGITVIGFTGRLGGEMPNFADLLLRAPSDSTPLIQQVHITSGHVICGLVEQNLFPR